MFYRSPGCDRKLFSLIPCVYRKCFACGKFQVSNAKRTLGCLGLIGDQKLPSYVAMASETMKDPDPGTLNNNRKLHGKYPDGFGFFVPQVGTDNICDYSFYNIRGFHVPLANFIPTQSKPPGQGNSLQC